MYLPMGKGRTVVSSIGRIVQAVKVCCLQEKALSHFAISPQIYFHICQVKNSYEHFRP